ncbi:hypothetical protein ACVIGB_008765 [Bradyrhizobium sp. USDA 4341]
MTNHMPAVLDEHDKAGDGAREAVSGTQPMHHRLGAARTSPARPAETTNNTRCCRCGFAADMLSPWAKGYISLQSVRRGAVPETVHAKL